MGQRTLFDEPETVATPIARASDPETSHQAAAKTESGRTELQMICLGVWMKLNAAMTVKEVAAEVMRRHFSHIRQTDERYPTQLDNCRKRANEVANKHGVKQEERRDGCRVFRIKSQ